MLGILMIGLEITLMIVGIITCFKICNVCDIYIQEHKKRND